MVTGVVEDDKPGFAIARNGFGSRAVNSAAEVDEEFEYFSLNDIEKPDVIKIESGYAVNSSGGFRAVAGVEDLLDGETFVTEQPEIMVTLQDQFIEVRNKLQEAIDAKAVAQGFSSGNALMLYAGFENHYRSLAQVFATWEASVWVEANTYKDEVLDGTKPMLTGAEAVALMPPYPED